MVLLSVGAYQHWLPGISAARMKGTGLEMASDIYRGEVAVHVKIWQWKKSKFLGLERRRCHILRQNISIAAQEQGTT